MKNQITFGQLAGKLAVEKERFVKHSTCCMYKLIIRTHLLPAFGASTAVGEAEAQKFVLGKLESGMRRTTVRSIVAVLRSVLKYGARRWGIRA